MVKKPQLKLVVAPRVDGPKAWLAQVARGYTESEREQFRPVLEYVAAACGNQALSSGEPLLAHALGTAGIVAELKLDAEVVAAALLASCPALATNQAQSLRDRFGGATFELAEGATRLAQMQILSSRHPPEPKPEQQAAQQEVLRKMLLAMVQDVRVVVIKLADHTQELRYAVSAEAADAQRDAAQLTSDIFAPLANRLGIWQLKSEMEDLALRIREPQAYARIAQLLDETLAEREHYIENVIAQLKSELTHASLVAEVTGRPKHIFSIYKKMKRKGGTFESLYDVRAVRVLVTDVASCYAALGQVHNLWTPIPGAFDDYIAKPKSNLYRSLHTAVIGPGNKALEVQIRTHEMHRHSELGVAAHWRYKEGSRPDRGYDRKISWLRQILEWKDELGDAGELAERFRTGLLDDTIYVLTPLGRVIALPKGSTAVDFAYHVHTELGHRCRGAKVDGAMVPLNTPLSSGQQVEILAAKQGGPSRDWLNPELGYIKSTATRAKIRHWFNRQNLETAMAQGRALVEQELRRQGMTALALDKLAAHLGFDEPDKLLADVGRGEVRSRQLEQAVRSLDPRADPPAAGVRDDAPTLAARKGRPASRSSGVLVVGVDRLLAVPAKCCKPAPPDAISGFITRGRGITIHRASCASLKRLDAGRQVAAEWGAAGEATFPVDIEVLATNRTGLTREISEVLARETIRIAGSRSVEEDAMVRLRYTLEVADLAQLGRTLTLIRAVKGVSRAARR